MGKFWIDNKVFLLGLLGSVLIVLQQFTTESEPSYKAIGFAVFLAVLSYVAKNWRGQSTSMVGIVTTALATIVQSYQEGGSISWLQIMVQVLGVFIATQSPDAKSKGYEHTDAILAAKAEGEGITPALLTKKP